jgi:hypothetical protein
VIDEGGALSTKNGLVSAIAPARRDSRAAEVSESASACDGA